MTRSYYSRSKINNKRSPGDSPYGIDRSLGASSSKNNNEKYVKFKVPKTKFSVIDGGLSNKESRKQGSQEQNAGYGSLANNTPFSKTPRSKSESRLDSNLNVRSQLGQESKKSSRAKITVPLGSGQFKSHNEVSGVKVAALSALDQSFGYSKGNQGKSRAGLIATSGSKSGSKQSKSLGKVFKKDKKRGTTDRIAMPFGPAFSALASRVSPRLMAFLVTVLVILCLVLLIYPAARENYISVRQLVRSNAELELIEQRNEEIQDLIDELGTDEGIEDYVRSQYGWVKEGETSGLVSSLDSESQNFTLPTSVSSEDVVVEDGFLEEILDAFFFINDD